MNKYFRGGFTPPTPNGTMYNKEPKTVFTSETTITCIIYRQTWKFQVSNLVAVIGFTQILIFWSELKSTIHTVQHLNHFRKILLFLLIKDLYG